MTTQSVRERGLREQPLAGAPSRTTLLENEEVLVVATTYPPGAGVPIHTHRYPQVAYVLDGGTIETTAPNGTVETYEVRAGETLWSAAAHAHSARNVGPTPVRIVEVEVKHATPATHEPPRRPIVLVPATLEWSTDTHDSRRATARLLREPGAPGPYTVRFRLPAGYAMGLHLHPDDDEQLTVLSGAMGWSMGAVGSGAPEYALPAGGFVLTPAGTPHRIWALEECVIQMSGVGPRSYIYLDPAEAPAAERSSEVGVHSSLDGAATGR